MRRLFDSSVLVIVLALACVACQGDADPQDEGSLTERGSRPGYPATTSTTVAGNARAVFQLEVGACLDDVLGADGSTVTSVREVPCSQAHQAQVYAVFDVDLPAYPGDEAMLDVALDGCDARVPASLSGDWGADGTYAPFVLQPTSRSWRLDDREVVCMAMRVDEADIIGTLV